MDKLYCRIVFCNCRHDDNGNYPSSVAEFATKSISVSLSTPFEQYPLPSPDTVPHEVPAKVHCRLFSTLTIPAKVFVAILLSCVWFTGIFLSHLLPRVAAYLIKQKNVLIHSPSKSASGIPLYSANILQYLIFGGGQCPYDTIQPIQEMGFQTTG